MIRYTFRHFYRFKKIAKNSEKIHTKQKRQNDINSRFREFMSSFRFFPPKKPTWEIHAALWNGVGWSHTYGGDCKSDRNIWNEFFFQHFNEFFFRHVSDLPDTIFQQNAIFSVPVKPSPHRNRKCCSFRGEALWETIPLFLILNNNKMNFRLTI